MKLRRVLLVLAIAIPALHFCSASCNAQWKCHSQPSQRLFRLMGHGWSAGYHHRNPGHDSSYYNPYSHHNSSLRTQWNASSMNSFGFSHSLQTPAVNDQVIDPDFPTVDADVNRTPNERESQDSPPSNESFDPQSRLKKDRPAGRGGSKREIEKTLPFKFN